MPNNWELRLLDSPLVQRAGKFVFGKIFHGLALTNPFVAKVYGAYRLAKAIYNNLGALKEIAKAYRKHGLLGALWTAGEGRTSDLLSSEQDELLSKTIPPRYRTLGRRLLSSGVAMLTDSEMSFLDRHL